MKGTTMADLAKALVAISPATTSKINWTQIISMVVGTAAIFGIAIPEEWQTFALEFLVIATPILTMIWRNWFHGTDPTVADVKAAAADKGLVAVPASAVKPSANL
jgi:hypothetical protein